MRDMRVRLIKIKDHSITYAVEGKGQWILADGTTIEDKDVNIIDIASDEVEELFEDVLNNFKEKEKIENEFVIKQNEVKEKNNKNDEKLKELLHIIDETEFVNTFLENLSQEMKIIMKSFIISTDLNMEKLPVLRLRRRSLVEPVDSINQFVGDDFEFETHLIAKYSFFIESPYISNFGNYIEIDEDQRGWYIHEYYDFDISCMTADEAIKLAHSIINY